MTLTTLPPVLESAVEKAALMALNMKREQNGFPVSASLDGLPAADKAEWLNDTALTALALLNALLADGKASMVRGKYSGPVGPRDQGVRQPAYIIIPLSEPLP